MDISGRLCFVIFRKQNKTKSEPREEAGAKDWLLVVHKSWRENEKTDCILGDNGGENKEKRKNWGEDNAWPAAARELHQLWGVWSSTAETPSGGLWHLPLLPTWQHRRVKKKLNLGEKLRCFYTIVWNQSVYCDYLPSFQGYRSDSTLRYKDKLNLREKLWWF